MRVSTDTGPKVSTLKNVTIYTDGACSGNPGPGGYAAVLCYNGHKKEIVGAEDETTNNRMELLAVIVGLESLNRKCAVDIISDSRYVIDCIEKGWAVRWRQNGWMRNKKESAKNVDLLERLLAAVSKHCVKFHWVAGHSGCELNERCDTLARGAIANRHEILLT